MIVWRSRLSRNVTSRVHRDVYWLERWLSAHLIGSSIVVSPDARRQLMNKFHGRVREAVREATRRGTVDATVFLLDLRDELAQKMATEVADIDAVRNVVTTAEQDHTAPILVACVPAMDAASLMRHRSRKTKRKFAGLLPCDRFRVIAVASGGITWALVKIKGASAGRLIDGL
jgi:hypothetical protein